MPPFTLQLLIENCIKHKVVLPTPDELLIGKEKTTAFLEWMGER